MYKISILKRAEKDIKKLDRSNKNRVVKAIMDLAEESRPIGCRKILSEKGVWRIRIGDWRVGYTIDDNLLEVTIIRIASRGEFYNWDKTQVKNYKGQIRYLPFIIVRV